MKILLISTRMGTAGVETLILRMAKFLSEKDHSVDVLLMREVDKNMADALRQYSRVLIGWKFIKTAKSFKKSGKKYYDYLYTFSFFPLLYAFYIHQKYFPFAKLSFGVYHPLEYCWAPKSKSFLSKLAARLIKNFPEKNIFFMNQVTKDRHQQKLKQTFLQSPIIPIPVDIEKYQGLERNFQVNKPYKIVSIGRITAFKSYNFLLIDVIADLINQGAPLEYHIYGNGEESKKLVKQIRQKNMQSAIFFHGTLPYEAFSKVLKNAFLFIGMGTALVEASACKVPCLQSIEMDHAAESYGFFHAQSGYNLGEKNDLQPTYPYQDLIKKAMNLSQDKYLDICHLSYKRSEDFAIETVMESFLMSLSQTQNINFKLNPFTIGFALSSAIFWFFCQKIHIKTPHDRRYTQS